MTIAFRAADLNDPTDLDFVVSGWSSSYKHSRSAGMIWSADWASVMHPQIRRQLERPNVRTIIAVEDDDPDAFYGFVTGDTSWRYPIVFYVFVKEPYRRAGYARGLVQALGVDLSRTFHHPCWTPVLAKLKDKMPFARHNADLARYPSYDPPAKEHAKWKR